MKTYKDIVFFFIDNLKNKLVLFFKQVKEINLIHDKELFYISVYIYYLLFFILSLIYGFMFFEKIELNTNLLTKDSFQTLNSYEDGEKIGNGKYIRIKNEILEIKRGKKWYLNPAVKRKDLLFKDNYLPFVNKWAVYRNTFEEYINKREKMREMLTPKEPKDYGYRKYYPLDPHKKMKNWANENYGPNSPRRSKR